MTERSVFTEILALYRDLPCLWDNSNELYKNKHAREESMSILLEKWKTIDPSANKDTVKKKLENMRTTFIREWRKVKNSKTMGDDRIYKPTLWYYEDMLFLLKAHNPKRNVLNIMSENTDSEDGFKEEKKSRGTKRRRMRKSQRKQARLHDDAPEMLSSEDNQIETIGQTFANQLKEMSQLQRWISEKMISEVLFYGKLDLLTIDSTISINNRIDDSMTRRPSISVKTRSETPSS